MTASFSLLDEPWIECLHTDGTVGVHTLTEVLVSAHELVDIRTVHATERTALVRLLLAFLHRAVDGPTDSDSWEDIWAAGRFDPAPIGEYTARWHDRFDLSDEKYPFFQVAGLEPVGISGWKTWDEAAFDSPGNERNLFVSRRGEAAESAAPADAALWLIHTHAVDPAGIRTGAVGDPAVNRSKSYGNTVGWMGQLTAVLVGGSNLFETLMLNLIPRKVAGAGSGVALSGPDDLPAWEKADTFTAAVRSQEARPTGPVDLFTWQSRRLRLRLDEAGRVTHALRCGGPRLPSWNLMRSESHTVWVHSKRQSTQQKTTVYRPQVVDPAVQPWRGLAAYMPTVASSTDREHIPPTSALIEWISYVTNVLGLHDQLLRLDRSGVAYGEQAAIVDRVLGDTLAVPAALVNAGDPDVQTLVQRALAHVEQAAKSIRTLAWVMATAVNSSHSTEAANEAKQRLYSELDGPIRAWLAGLDVSGGLDAQEGAARRTVLDTALRLGNEIVAQAGPGAWRPRDKGVDPGRAWRNFLNSMHDATPVTGLETEGEAI